LAKYPGPVLAKITDWYSVYHAWKGDRHLEFWRCHEKYGESAILLGTFPGKFTYGSDIGGSGHVTYNEP
jgi:hypothetical protein